MDGGVFPDKENGIVKGDKMKGEAMAKGSIVVGNMPRKKLSDISNLPLKVQDAKPLSVSVNTKEYIHKLHQENLTLVKLLADRNKIIQSHAFELQRLKTRCQQVQQKNLELAQSNSQMLAEVNSNKDRLKVLQHELGCKNGLLTAMKLELEDKTNLVRCRIRGNEVETPGHGEVGKISDVQHRDNELHNQKRKQQTKSLDTTIAKPVQTRENIDKKRKSARLKAKEHPADDTFEISDDLEPHLDKPVEAEKVDEKRHCLRRQSARFKAAEQETIDDLSQTSGALDPAMVKPFQVETKADKKRISSRRQSARFQSQEQVQESLEDVFQIDDAKFPVSSLQESGPASSVSAVKCEPDAADSTSGSEAQESRRSSFRPKRQVCEKVQSYKEVPLNVKMRRPT